MRSALRATSAAPGASVVRSASGRRRVSACAGHQPSRHQVRECAAVQRFALQADGFWVRASAALGGQECHRAAAERNVLRFGGLCGAGGAVRPAVRSASVRHVVARLRAVHYGDGHDAVHRRKCGDCVARTTAAAAVLADDGTGVGGAAGDNCRYAGAGGGEADDHGWVADGRVDDDDGAVLIGF